MLRGDENDLSSRVTTQDPSEAKRGQAKICCGCLPKLVI